MPDMAKLRARMVEKHVTVEMLAKRLNVNIATLYRRLKEPETFTVGDVLSMMDYLHLSVEDVEFIFH